MNNEVLDSLVAYTIRKIARFFPERDIKEISCICDIECGIMLMFFDFPFSMSVENLLKLNERLDKYLYFADSAKEGK